MRRHDAYEQDDRYGDRGRGGPAPRERERGIPDGLLLGVLAFLLGMTVMVWTATGLSGLFSKGAWPDGVTIRHTPVAMRSLIGRPHDLPGAWPDTPDGQLSGYGLFWGLFIGQVLVLIVLTVFVAGTVARWRAVRRRGRAEAAAAASAEPAPLAAPAPRAPVSEVPVAQAPVSEVPAAGPEPHESHEKPERQESPAAPAAPTTVPAPRGPVVLGPAETRAPRAIQAIRDAEGPVLVVTSSASVWAETKDARSKLGPVLVYDPTHLCDTPARLHWNPAQGCEDKPTAASRAAALLAPIRPTAKLDTATADTAETLLRSFLHAAALDTKPFRHVHRWAQGTQVQEAVRILRTSPKAAAGAAGELEAALTSHPERRDMAQELTARALSSLFSVHIREACTPNRTDALTLDSFANEGGTLYVVGEAIEDPKADPGAMPLLTALASSVVEHGRRMAERSSAGRLDPPMTLVLDDVAAVAPLPQLPELLSTGADRGLPTLALLRSREQGRARWPHAELPAP
ncbi:type IV secretory system conjugative DNA transfer family protein [Streptomyces sp. NBC_00569]|uniref:TraM recognition domain-containing protein n=1 Tax=unclassified Streptomyces TaxID=2593676 RepID=UPI0022579962|nr:MULTISPECIES: type VI secretion protein [unclassified Streptomyces]MCX5438230.1 type IV secretory system conjugative DNA transfer family protein [Streptomyces sp. NBC_00063]WUB99519.1 type IV secretory system conjugative DNA transfer family protein [Streptomyces sp. NBC_00569]